MKYYTTPDFGVRAAFFALLPEATEHDFETWKSDMLKEEGDPRLPMYGPANLCESALDHPRLQEENAISKEQHGLIMFALSHFQTMINVFATIRDYDRHHGLPTS